MTLYNPALSEEPRNQRIKVIPPSAQETLLNWLEAAGRLKPHEKDNVQDHKLSEDLEDFLDAELRIMEDEEELMDQEE